MYYKRCDLNNFSFKIVYIEKLLLNFTSTLLLVHSDLSYWKSSDFLKTSQLTNNACNSKPFKYIFVWIWTSIF